MSMPTDPRAPGGTGLDPEMVEMLRTSLRHVLTEEVGRGLDDRLAELGWDEVVAGDAPTALGLLFEIKGDTLSSADALGPRLSRTLADVAGDDALASTSVALPSPFGTSSVDKGSLRIDAVTMSMPASGLVAVPVDARLALVGVDRLSPTELGGTDEWLGTVRLRGETRTADVEWIDGDVWSSIVDQGRWLLACELVGIGRHVVASAVEYTGERVQYGKPIGVFQALQHRLAGAHSMVVGAAHLAKEAGVAGDSWSALVAKCMAGQAAEHACTQAQQCYGAIGFTWEHEFHRYLRRTYVLDRLLGDWRSLEHDIGEALQRSGVVPHIGEL